jgi:hypothetical protein
VSVDELLDDAFRKGLLVRYIEQFLSSSAAGTSHKQTV